MTDEQNPVWRATSFNVYWCEYNGVRHSYILDRAWSRQFEYMWWAKCGDAGTSEDDWIVPVDQLSNLAEIARDGFPSQATFRKRANYPVIPEPVPKLA